MTLSELRQTVAELSQALDWLAGYVRQQSESTAAELALAAAVVRNVVGPYLEGVEAPPLHLAVVGGAGAGKSTVVNFLLGRPVAETNPQAGYTRHPTAFIVDQSHLPWPQTPGFLNGLQAVTTPRSADEDADIYQIRRLTPLPEEPLQHCIIWDCPDLTTWAASGYVRRLWEVAALADLIVYVASDERYNDLVPTQFLHLLVRAGKPVMVVLTKVAADQSERLVDHFRQEVLGRLPRRSDGTLPDVPVLVLPLLTAEQRRDPGGAGAVWRIPLVNQVLTLTANPPLVRRRQVHLAFRYLQLLIANLEQAVRTELDEFQSWQELVRQGRLAFERRYAAEYLEAERFVAIDRCRQAWMDLLELPAAGRWLSAIFWVLRTPYRAARDYVRRWWQQAALPPSLEADVLRAAAAAWRDALHAETLRRLDRHPFWQQLAQRFSSELLPAWHQQWDTLSSRFVQQEREELEHVCQRLLESLQTRPGRLAVARLGKLTVDLGALALLVYLTWPLDWYHLLLVPLCVSLTHQGVEWLIAIQLESQRRRLRQQRAEHLHHVLAGPLEQWLQQWPATSGSSVARLQQALRQAPAALERLEAVLAVSTSSVTPQPAALPDGLGLSASATELSRHAPTPAVPASSQRN
ncbi:MAG: 50S ribosome-binding GTPase [Gemmataceae bacterium]|nr:50S ribosome-binding GTPase [Gemmataceae bacterium]MDW8242644.1 GTPase [Thermogemmata sp.]